MSENSPINNPKVVEAIKTVITTRMDRVMNRVLFDDPFLPDEHRAKKPLYAALVPDEIFKGSHFERRFVTPFGQVWEKLGQVVGESGRGKAIMSHAIRGTVKKERLRRITEILNRLEHDSKKTKDRIRPDWTKELKYILEGRGRPVPIVVICDLYVEDLETNESFAFELKAPLPNSDQTKVSKEKVFKLYAMEPQPVTDAFFALPYNPYGKKEDYDWSFPKRWFDMINDPCILIGNEFWDFVGGEGTYQEFIKIIKDLGKNYQDRIYKEYLGIVPPEGAGEIII